MRKLSTLIIPLLLAGCAGQSDKNTDIPVIDLAAAIEQEPVNELEFRDVRFTPLDTSAVALFSERSLIKGVKGDTIMIADDVNRLVLFSLADGKFINEINRKGNGPGEYSWIQCALLDDATAQITISDANGNHAILLTLNDSLISDTPYRKVSGTRLPAGDTRTCINIGEDTDEGYKIHQFDRFMNEIDSLTIAGFDMNYYGGEFFSSNGRTALLTNLSDTLLTLLPGRMEPFVVINRGGKEITPAVAEKIMADYRSVSRGDYLDIYNSAWDDNHFYTLSAYQDNFHLNMFDLPSGRMVYHRSLNPRDEERNTVGFEVPFEGKTYHLRFLFVKDNRWYGIVSEEEALDDDTDEGNCAIISFTL